MRATLTLLSATLVLGSGAFQTKADDLFEITAQSLADVRTAGGSSVVDLVKQVVDAEGQFSIFAGQSYQAFLRYGGVHNAVFFNINATGTSAQLQIPATGFFRDFNGPDRQSVERQIEDFVKSNGEGEWAKFLKTINAQSPVAVSDGNPNSATAFSAAQTYNQFGSSAGLTRDEMESPDGAEQSSHLGLEAEVGRFDASGFSGTTYALPLYANFQLTDRVGLALNIPLKYIELEGADIFSVGVGIGLPIKVIKRTKDRPWFWQVTPSGGVLGAGSEDLATGDLLTQGGLTSLLEHRFKWLTLAMGNQVSWLEGVAMDIGDFQFDPGVSQQIVKNGLKASVPFGRRWIFELYGIHTKFLENASVDEYVTVGGDIGFRSSGKPGSARKKRGYVKAGIYSDVGNDYSSQVVRFGTGWRF